MSHPSTRIGHWLGAGILAATLGGPGPFAEAGHDVPLFPSASDTTRQGFIRIINHADRAGDVEISPIDDDGNGPGPLVLAIDANEAVHLNSPDVENGNPAKGLDAGAGSGSGDWRLEITSDLDIEVLAYIRTTDGFVSSMHEVVAPGADATHAVSFFNPGDAEPASNLRLINPGTETATVTITGVDDQGETPGTEVEVSIAAGGARTLTAEELESGDDTFTGALGDGTGKWRLTVSSDQAVTVVNLLASSAGPVANLSSEAPGTDATGMHRVPLFPGSSNTTRQGLVRVINRSDAAGTVHIEMFDTSTRDYEPITLGLDANEAAQFDTDDLELGNAEIGLSGGVGAGEGDWRLALSSDLDIEVRAYSLTQDDFLTAMHEIVRVVGYRHRVALFNPGSNRAQVSQLRLANRVSGPALVSITGIDDHGKSPGSGVTLSVAAGETRILTAPDLEAGSLDFDGELGDGAGKWQLIVESDAPIHVMNLMANPTGHLTNLSSVPRTTAPANRSAFDDRAVGKRIVQRDGERFVDLLPEGGYRETRDGETTTGSYSYENTGVSTASLSLTADDASSCTSDLVFESRLSGRLNWCGDGEVDFDWRLLEPSTQDGDTITYQITAMISTLESDPEVVRGASVSVSDAVVRIDFENGGYVEWGEHRFTCRDSAGCVIDNQLVTRGRVVQTTALGERDFDVDDANGSPVGLAYGRGHFYVVDASDLKVYAYDAFGERAAALDFDLAASNTMPAGITLGSDRFYVVDEDEFLDEHAPRTVFVYDAAGQHLPDATIDVDATVREPLGIAYFNDRLFLADAWTDTVYAYRASGERDADADFLLTFDNGSPRGIAYGNGRFFVVDISDDKVYAYLTDGKRDRDADFNLVDGNSLSRGIAYVDARFFVADADRVFAYPSDRPDLVVDAFSVDEEMPAAGGTFTVDVTVRNIGHRRAAATTLRYYRSVDTTIPRNDDEVGHDALNELAVAEIHQQSHDLRAPSRAGFFNFGVCIDALPDEYDRGNCSDALEITVPVDTGGPTVGFALDSDNRNPTGIAYNNGRFFVLDSRDDHVYAYRRSAARDVDADFSLHADNSRPVAIAYASSKFYVVDTGDDKVYAYNAAGERDADADFALDSDNQSPFGIAVAGDRFYVADASDDKVYVYGAAGEREAGADFDLFSGNGTPWGMAFAENRLFVVDLLDDHVYVYTTAGERDSAVEFNLDRDNGSPDGIALANGRLFVTDATDSVVYGYAIPKVADLTVDDAAVSDGTPGAGDSFTFTATVRNLGDGRSHGTGMRYYLASDSAYDTSSDNLVGTGSVSALEPGAAQDVSFAMTAPTDDGCYYCGACVSFVRGERVRTNNCAVPAEILLGDGPDMDVSRLQIHTAGVGGPVEVQIGVINRGTGPSRAGKLRFTGGDNVVIDIPALDPDEEEIFDRQQIGTGQAGTTTYEICIDVPCEVNPEDNCRTRSISL